MTETRRIQLHLGKCIEDLEELHNVPDLKSKRATMLCKTALKLFESAEEARSKGDEEYSYVYFMKYLRVIAYISKDKEYLKHKSYFTNMLGAVNPTKAIDAAEILKNSLIDRYAKEQKVKRLNDIKENEIIKQKIEENRKEAIDTVTVTETLPIGLPDPDEVIISSENLYQILKSGKLKVMILDARPGKDYIDSHINHPACISIPEESLSPGQSANVLGQILPAESKVVWAQRAAMELIVLLDWNSAAVIPGKTLFLLKAILQKWDVNVKYSRAPLALRGGYEDWVLKYPAFCTNPNPIGPPRPDSLDFMLGDIEYPKWSEVSPPAAAPRRPSEPPVDRTSKAAALQMYRLVEQQERLAHSALTLEMQRIEAEQDWEKIRSQGEDAQAEDLRADYKLREQEILSQLMQLENKQYDMEQENLSLREQLEEYQRRERDDAQKLAETIAQPEKASTDVQAEAARLAAEQATAREIAAKRQRIAAVAHQTQELDRTREAMELERNRILMEARGKRKPNLNKEESSGDTYMVSPSESPGAADLGRSHSSPNIAKESSDEEESPPTFDRSTKPQPIVPQDNRRRDLQPVWGEVVSPVSKILRYERRCIPLDAANMVLKVKVRLKYSQNHIVWLFRRGRGLTGLKNLGNTCYMNSIIQCLNNTTILVSYFCNGQYTEHLNRSASTRGCVAEEVAAVVRALWSGQYRFIAPRDLRNEVGKHQRTFRGCEQQDSHEFLTILMDWLHLDLQFSIPHPHNKDNLPPSEKAWQEYTKSRESLVLRLFYGQIKSTVRCSVCNKQSVTYESFSNLSLELPANAARCSLSDCLKLYLNGETISGWQCGGCRAPRDAVKKLDISRLPPVLVVHFKRFYLEPSQYACNAYRKKQTYIDFPLDDLDMRQFSLSASAHNYRLYAVSNHYGSMESGHYTAYCNSSLYDKWYKFDDHVVSEISPSEVKSSAAYILFYTTCNTRLSS